MHKPAELKTSVIMPAHDTAAYIGPAIVSALMQTVPVLEVIVVDDGSTDGTAEIARSLSSRDARVRVLTNPESRGPSAARNRAIRESRGCWMALLDSDDLWHPTFLEAQFAASRAHPGAAVVTGNARSLGGSLDGQLYRPVQSSARSLTLAEMIERETSICIMSVFRREVFDEVGGFDESRRHNEDYEFWLRAAARGFRFVQSDEPLAWYRRRTDSGSADELQMLAGIVDVLARTKPECTAAGVDPEVIQRRIALFERQALMVEAKAALRARDWNIAAARFRAIASRDPRTSQRLLAAVSRRAPQALFWIDAVRTRIRQLPSAVRRGRATVEPPPPPEAGRLTEWLAARDAARPERPR